MLWLWFCWKYLFPASLTLVFIVGIVVSVRHNVLMVKVMIVVTLENDDVLLSCVNFACLCMYVFNLCILCLCMFISSLFVSFFV